MKELGLKAEDYDLSRYEKIRGSAETLQDLVWDLSVALCIQQVWEISVPKKEITVNCNSFYSAGIHVACHASCKGHM